MSTTAIVISVILSLITFVAFYWNDILDIIEELKH
jgi:hypothetical protein